MRQSTALFDSVSSSLCSHVVRSSVDGPTTPTTTYPEPPTLSHLPPLCAQQCMYIMCASFAAPPLVVAIYLTDCNNRPTSDTTADLRPRSVPVPRGGSRFGLSTAGRSAARVQPQGVHDAADTVAEVETDVADERVNHDHALQQYRLDQPAVYPRLGVLGLRLVQLEGNR